VLVDSFPNGKSFMDKMRTMKRRKKTITSYNLQDEDNEEEKEKDFSHNPEILDGAPPVAEAPVRVGHDDGQQRGQRPEINKIRFLKLDKDHHHL
jgi:hypothetical protein